MDTPRQRRIPRMFTNSLECEGKVGKKGELTNRVATGVLPILRSQHSFVNMIVVSDNAHPRHLVLEIKGRCTAISPRTQPANRQDDKTSCHWPAGRREFRSRNHHQSRDRSEPGGLTVPAMPFQRAGRYTFLRVWENTFPHRAASVVGLTSQR
jgi:hypothetical protein